MTKRIGYLGIIIAFLLCGMIKTGENVIALNVPEASSQAWFPLPTAGESRAPVPGGPGYVIASPFAIIPELYSTQYRIEGSLLKNLSPNQAIFRIPLNLPHGATITKLVAYSYDGDATYNINVYLYRDAFDNMDGQLMGYALSSGSPGYTNSSDSSIDYAEVDLSSYGYSLKIYLHSSEYAPSYGFLGARIDYEYPVFLPEVVK